MEQLTKEQENHKKKLDILSRCIKADVISLEEALFVLEQTATEPQPKEEKVEMPSYNPSTWTTITTTPNTVPSFYYQAQPNPISGGSSMSIASSGSITFTNTTGQPDNNIVTPIQEDGICL
jgi:hypothetical protein